MEALIISGGKCLHGVVPISGAKNAVLPILAATVIHGGQYILHNCPRIEDVSLAVQIMELLGGRIRREGETLFVDTTAMHSWRIPVELMAQMRASVLFLGALLARFGRAVLTMPGGCPLGRRPIDLHLHALAQMGASVTLVEERIHCEAPRLHGCQVDFSYPSVGATENALLAAVACRGTVILQGCAREPEVADLTRFLRTMGARIEGAGTQTLVIHGGEPLHGTEYTVLPDRIETATYLCAAAGCGGDVTLENTDANLLEPVLEVLLEAGCEIACSCDSIRLRMSGALRPVQAVETAPYPGFPTDVQAPMMAALLRAGGESRLCETVFERRFAHVEQLRRFGAEIETCGACALVRGVARLHAACAAGADLRGTAALVLCALQASGESEIFGLKHLRRGYATMEEKLYALGAEVRIQERRACS